MFRVPVARMGRVLPIADRQKAAKSRHSPYVRWARSRNARCARARLALWPVGAAKRKRLFTRAARKEIALHVGSAIMPILSEAAPYDFRP